MCTLQERIEKSKTCSHVVTTRIFFPTNIYLCTQMVQYILFAIHLHSYNYPFNFLTTPTLFMGTFLGSFLWLSIQKRSKSPTKFRRIYKHLCWHLGMENIYFIYQPYDYTVKTMQFNIMYNWYSIYIHKFKTYQQQEINTLPG